MAIVHSQASGMGGVRTCGDLVARAQLQKGMRLNDAKKFVAEKLKVDIKDLTDEVVMRETREDLDIGTVYMGYGSASRGMEAKIRIAEILDIKINCVEKFKEKTGLK